MSPQAASYTTISCFLGGVAAIQGISRILHHYMPSHVVDCDQSHEDEDCDSSANLHKDGTHEYGHLHEQIEIASEIMPLLSGEDAEFKQNLAQRPRSASSDIAAASIPRHTREILTSQPSLSIRHPNPVRTATVPNSQHQQGHFTSQDEDSLPSSAQEGLHLGQPSHKIRQRQEGCQSGIPFRSSSDYRSISVENNHSSDSLSLSRVNTAYDASHQHHHHVPTNSFLDIGLQTSIAIALHKLPEGFITFATNHANPHLGLAVFMALFIHNITEGFAMALPLYLALRSRWKSMFWSSLLGGLSQPLGAGVAALWFKLAGRGDMAPGDIVYGCMFAITAGVMTSVALQLFSESLSLKHTHSRSLCIAFAFIGMGILGVSFALTAS